MTMLGVVCGLAFEAEILAPYRSERLAVACAGLSPGAARRAAESLLSRGATVLMSFGIAGALDPGLKAGAPIIATEVRAAGLPPVVCDPQWVQRLIAIPHPFPSPQGGGVILAHTATVLQTPTDKAALFAATGAAAADMESYAVGEVTRERGVPFAVLRAVADTAGDAVPSVAVSGMGEDGRVQLTASVIGALTHPWQIPDLIALGRRTAHARRVLAALAGRGAPQLFGCV